MKIESELARNLCQTFKNLRIPGDPAEMVYIGFRCIDSKAYAYWCNIFGIWHLWVGDYDPETCMTTFPLTDLYQGGIVGFDAIVPESIRETVRSRLVMKSLETNGPGVYLSESLDNGLLVRLTTHLVRTVRTIQE